MAPVGAVVGVLIPVPGRILRVLFPDLPANDLSYIDSDLPSFLAGICGLLVFPIAVVTIVTGWVVFLDLIVWLLSGGRRAPLVFLFERSTRTVIPATAIDDELGELIEAHTSLPDSSSITRPGQVGRHILRNLSVWSLCLAGFCVIDYFHVYHVPLSWSAPLFLPVLFGATIFANRGLFPYAQNAASRWTLIGMISILIVIGSGCVLMLMGTWFHIIIGGAL